LASGAKGCGFDPRRAQSYIRRYSSRRARLFFGGGKQNSLQGNDPARHAVAVSKNYIVETKAGYLAVVEGDGETEITDAETVDKIRKLLEERKEVGKKISKLIYDKGLITASAHHATIALGEFKEGERKRE
jgi:hypothetical protein